MWNFPKDTKHEQKCYVTHGAIGHVDPKQPPTKRKPFANILDHQFINKVEMILPKELYDIMENEIFADSRSPVYSRVILPLETLVQGDFFTEYIKKGNNSISAGDGSTCFIPTEAYEMSGNILMLSEGRIGVDNVFSLSEGNFSVLRLHDARWLTLIGILTLHLDKETYERSGLVGKPEGIKGKREHRPRWSTSALASRGTWLSIT
jgi:ribonuclease P/MRP protein subunit RPP40